MTNPDRRALAAALRHGRTRYAFRPGYYRELREYSWYPKPFDGRYPPVVRASNLGDGVWYIACGDAAATADSVERALSALAFFGVYQPEMAEVAS